MDEETLRMYRARLEAALDHYGSTYAGTPEDAAAYAAYDEAYCMWQLAKAAYEAAQSADEARGEPNGH